MGKSSKKANAEVSVPAISVPSAKSHKKGKREAQETLEKVISAKKQKKDANLIVPKQNEKDDKKSKKVSKLPTPKKKAGANSSEDTTTSESEEGPAEEESSEDESSKDSEDEKAVKKTKKPQTPAVTQTQASDPKTLFVGNLSFDAGQDDVVEFFKEAGEVVDVRLATSECGGRRRGFCHAEFATAEGAQKALELNGQELLGRAVKLGIAHERGACTPQTGKESCQKGSKGQKQTVFVKGFDRNRSEDQIRSSLEEHFKSCGKITRISIPTDSESGASKGIAYLDFKDTDAVSQALGLNDSEIDEGFALTVEEAKPKSENPDGGFNGGRGGGRRGGGRFGRRGGRGGGGRRGGRGGGRGRGRG